MGDCACICVDLDNTAEFSRSTILRARKEHICDECSRIIVPGEKYEYVTGKWDGEFSSFKTCSDCLSVRKSFFCAGYEYTRIFDDLADHIWDMDGEISSDCLAPLTKRARDTVCDMIEDHWEKWSKRYGSNSRLGVSRFAFNCRTNEGAR